MSNIIGTWRLVKASSADAEGRPLPPPYGGEKGMGRVTFNTDGRMIAVLCDGRPTLPEGEPREYNSYCGNYTFDGRQLVTRVDAAKPPQPDDEAQIMSGTRTPINVGGDDIFLPPAPGGPYGAMLSSFNGMSPDGVWKLYVLDDEEGDQAHVSNHHGTHRGSASTPTRRAPLYRPCAWVLQGWCGVEPVRLFVVARVREQGTKLGWVGLPPLSGSRSAPGYRSDAL